MAEHLGRAQYDHDYYCTGIDLDLCVCFVHLTRGCCVTLVLILRITGPGVDMRHDERSEGKSNLVFRLFFSS